MPCGTCRRVQIVGRSSICLPGCLTAVVVLHAGAEHLHLLQLGPPLQRRRLLRPGICADGQLGLPRFLKLNRGFCF